MSCTALTSNDANLEEGMVRHETGEIWMGIVKAGMKFNHCIGVQHWWSR